MEQRVCSLCGKPIKFGAGSNLTDYGPNGVFTRFFCNDEEKAEYTTRVGAGLDDITPIEVKQPETSGAYKSSICPGTAEEMMRFGKLIRGITCCTTITPKQITDFAVSCMQYASFAITIKFIEDNFDELSMSMANITSGFSSGTSRLKYLAKILEEQLPAYLKIKENAEAEAEKKNKLPIPSNCFSKSNDTYFEPKSGYRKVKEEDYEWLKEYF